jgi:hypothetical protein
VAASDFDVANPKDIITQALPKIGGLQTTIAARLTDLAYGAWYGPTDDVLQVISMPVFMIQQALESMAHVKAIGEEQAKRDKISLILEILGIVFIFVPFLDDVLPEVEALDGIWGLVAAAGNVGLTIQAIIADPESAPVQLLGLLTAGGSRSEEDFCRDGRVAEGHRRRRYKQDWENLPGLGQRFPGCGFACL